MNPPSLRIIFMGTPEFAVPSLRILVRNGFDVAAVVTAPDKPSGRGLRINTSAVKDFAVAENIPVLQPQNLKDPAFLEALKSYKANLQIVVAFRMLPESVWSMPELGTFNLHASLLPQYRGAAPINWAIINGEKETGCTTFFLKHEIDTGDIIFQEKTSVSPDEDCASLYTRLMNMGAELVLKTVKAIEKKEYTTRAQSFSGNLKTAPKLTKETCKIPWREKTSSEVLNLIRGLSPYPAAWTTIQEKTCKIFKARVANNIPADPGNIPYLTDNKTFLHFYTKDGMVAVEELQMEGKKRMTVAEFLRGNKL